MVDGFGKRPSAEGFTAAGCAKNDAYEAYGGPTQLAIVTHLGLWISLEGCFAQE
jgi:hypothetical protein